MGVGEAQRVGVVKGKERERNNTRREREGQQQEKEEKRKRKQDSAAGAAPRRGLARVRKSKVEAGPFGAET